jgi:endonuclease III
MNGVASYSRRLGIDLPSKKEEELFKWFLACLLFGKPIQTEIAERAYREIVEAGLVSPAAILRAGWDKLVRLLDGAHYVRYDFSTATKLLEVCRELTERYGTVTNLVAQAETAPRLSRRLREFKHVGPVTARIFLHEVRPVWYRESRQAKGKRAKARNGNGNARRKLRPRSASQKRSGR